MARQSGPHRKLKPRLSGSELVHQARSNRQQEPPRSGQEFVRRSCQNQKLGAGNLSNGLFTRFSRVTSLLAIRFGILLVGRIIRFFGVSSRLRLAFLIRIERSVQVKMRCVGKFGHEVGSFLANLDPVWVCGPRRSFVEGANLVELEMFLLGHNKHQGGISASTRS